MSDSTSDAPPISESTKAAGEFVLATRMLIKMGISFEDPRLAAAVNQLGWWPQVVFDLSENAEVRVDESDRVVEYKVTLSVPPEGDELDKRTSALIGWTQQLLGEEWAVVIQSRKRKNGRYKVLAKGARAKPLEAKPATLTDAPFPDAVTTFRRYRSNKPGLTTDEVDLGPILPPKQQ